LARVAFVLVFVGFNVAFMSQFVLGSQGMPRRYFDYLPMYRSLHGFSSVGAYILGFGFVVMLWMFLKSLRSGAPAPANPWHSAGYEWMTTTPPHAHNFAAPPDFSRGHYDYQAFAQEAGEPVEVRG
ncbi:MAG: cbb3-type cytochrome c oxidase subunit I, partial [Polyangiales bacterium]